MNRWSAVPMPRGTALEMTLVCFVRNWVNKDLRAFRNIKREGGNVNLEERLFNKLGAMTEKANLLGTIKCSSPAGGIRNMTSLPGLMGQADITGERQSVMYPSSMS